MPAERSKKAAKGAAGKEPVKANSSPVCPICPICIEETKKGLFLRVRVQPGASSNSVDGMHGEALKLRITAPPVEGAANRAVIEFLSGILRVKKSSLEITSGQSSRDKRVKIEGIGALALREIIQTHLDRHENKTE